MNVLTIWFGGEPHTISNAKILGIYNERLWVEETLERGLGAVTDGNSAVFDLDTTEVTSFPLENIDRMVCESLFDTDAPFEGDLNWESSSLAKHFEPED